MKITKLQFTGRDAYISNSPSVYVMCPDRARGIVDMWLEGDTVIVALADGSQVLIPKSSVYITCDPEGASARPLKPAKSAKPPALTADS